MPSDDGHSEKRTKRAEAGAGAGAGAGVGAEAVAKVTKLNSKLINWLIHLTVNGFSLWPGPSFVANTKNIYVCIWGGWGKTAKESPKVAL